MKRTRMLIGAAAMLLAGAMHAQRTAHAEDAPCAEDGTTRITPLHTDSLCSSALICIPQHVAPHYHRHHTEHVTVLEGRARMLLGRDTLDIGPGDVIVIPSGTPHGVWTLPGAPLKVMSVHAPAFDGKDRVPWAP